MACSGRRLHSYSWLLVNSWRKNSRNPFQTYMVGSKSGSKSWLQGRTPAWSTELAFQAPCGTGNQNRTQDWALDYHNKLRTRTILRAHSQNLFWRQSYPPPVYASRARRCWLQNEDNLRGTDHVRCSYIGRLKEIYHRIKQGLERNRTDIRRLKVTEINYNTVATSYKVYIYIYYLFMYFI